MFGLSSSRPILCVSALKSKELVRGVAGVRTGTSANSAGAEGRRSQNATRVAGGMTG